MLLRNSRLEISPIVVVDEAKLRALIYLLLMRLKEKVAIITLEGSLVFPPCQLVFSCCDKTPSMTEAT